MNVPHDSGEYSPAQIRFWLAGRCPQCRWSMLESAVEGGTGCSGMGSGRGERFGMAHLKADLERAADQLPIAWRSTRLIFSRQHRYSVWLARWAMAGSPATSDEHESELLPTAVEDAVWRMARSLGWDPSLTSAA